MRSRHGEGEVTVACLNRVPTDRLSSWLPMRTLSSFPSISKAKTLCFCLLPSHVNSVALTSANIQKKKMRAELERMTYLQGPGSGRQVRCASWMTQAPWKTGVLQTQPLLPQGTGGPVLPESHQSTESAPREEEKMPVLGFLFTGASGTAVLVASPSTKPSACEMGAFLCLH